MQPELAPYGKCHIGWRASSIAHFLCYTCPNMSSLVPSDYNAFLQELKARIQAVQVRAALSVNRELVLLYWSIGRDILVKQQKQGWGQRWSSVLLVTCATLSPR